MDWWQVSLILCFFGFLKEFRPSEPFVSPYLNGPWKNFTEAEINQDIYPVGTYSTFGLLVIVFLVTDWLCYKPVVIAEGVCGIITWSILSWGTSLGMMQVAEVFYGAFIATEVAYSTYMYSTVDKTHYQVVTSYTKTAVLLGKATSSFTAQILVLFSFMDYQQLNYLTVAAMCLATLWSLILPSVSKSAYFNSSTQCTVINTQDGVRTNSTVKQTDGNQFERVELIVDESTTQISHNQIKSFKSGFKQLCNDLLIFVKDIHCIKWSIWWSLSMCGYLQVTYYTQVLWQHIINENDTKVLYHGFINCAHSLLGALCTYLVGFVKINWDLYGEVVLAACSLLQGCLLIYSAKMSVILTGYILYIIYKILYQTTYTISSSEIAKCIKSENYALVFGINTFIALLGQSLATIILINIFKLNIKQQFMFYGLYYIVIGVGFLLAGCFTLVKYIRKM